MSFDGDASSPIYGRDPDPSNCLLLSSIFAELVNGGGHQNEQEDHHREWRFSFGSGRLLRKAWVILAWLNGD